MVDNITLYNKLALLPEHLKLEAGDFIDFLTEKAKKEKARPKPKFGSAKGMFVLKTDFDAPLEDFEEYTR